MEEAMKLNISSIVERWRSEEGAERFAKILKQRFFLSPNEKLDLVNAEGVDCDLRGIDLSGRKLYDFILYQADLEFANFSRAEVSGPVQEANLMNAHFSNSILTSTTFWKSKLVGANFANSKLLGCSFEESDLRSAILTNSYFDSLHVSNSDLRGADFQGCAFENCRFFNVALCEDAKEFWSRYSEDECQLINVRWLGQSENSD